MMVIACGGTAVFVAADETVFGVADNPLILVTVGILVGGGVAVLADE
jgi:hypothetical protein